eukprot:1928572-Pleurochrysis_carterae.AAC.1
MRVRRFEQQHAPMQQSPPARNETDGTWGSKPSLAKVAIFKIAHHKYTALLTFTKRRGARNSRCCSRRKCVGFLPEALEFHQCVPRKAGKPLSCAGDKDEGMGGNVQPTAD